MITLGCKKEKNQKKKKKKKSELNSEYYGNSGNWENKMIMTYDNMSDNGGDIAH